MNKKETIELFKFIRSVFSQFEVDQYKIDIWTKLLHDQNPAKVMKNAERHALENKFAPTIADLRERHLEAYNTNILDQIREWERNAAGQ